MNCLCCGKPLLEDDESHWHKKCIKHFFGTAVLPTLNDSELNEIVNHSIQHGITVTGVQEKLSLHLSKENPTRFTIVNYPSGYILKPQTKEYAHLPEQEDLAMRLAECVGIKTVPHALFMVKDKYAYITKRIDRESTENRDSMYAMEDFCQLANRLTIDKYNSSYENCGRIIDKYSSRPGIDISEMYIRIVFSYIIGNSDMHLKNFSLIETSPKSRIYVLSPAYDMLPVNIILPKDTKQMALTVNGKKKNIRYKDFMELAKHSNLSEKIAASLIKKVCSYHDKLLDLVQNSYLDDLQKVKLCNLITERIESLHS